MSIHSNKAESVIVCDLCAAETGWEDMVEWWVGVDEARQDLHLCPACQAVAAYCDQCQSVHRDGEAGLLCNYATCPQCERQFRAHPGYTGPCPVCVLGPDFVDEPTGSEVPAARNTCA